MRIFSTTLALCLTLPALAFAAGSDSSSPPTPTDTTKSCKKGMVFDAGLGKCVAPKDSRLDDDSRYDAVREFERALEMGPEFIDIRTKLGHVLRDMGRPEKAIREYERVKRSKPDFLPARIALGVTLYSVGRTEEAVAEWKRCLEIDGEDKSARLYLRMVEGDRAPKPGSALASSTPEPSDA